MQGVFASIFTMSSPLPGIGCALLDTGIVFLLILAALLLGGVIERVFKAIAASFLPSGFLYVLEDYLTWPGLVLHELSHALFAILTGCQVTKISLFPSNHGGEATLGYVEYNVSHNRFLSYVQQFVAGIAPTVMCVLVMVLIVLFAFPKCDALWQYLIWGYLFVCALLHCELSSTDIMGAIRGIPIILVVALAIFLVFPVDPSGIPDMISSIGSHADSAGIEKLDLKLMPDEGDPAITSDMLGGYEEKLDK